VPIKHIQDILAGQKIPPIAIFDPHADLDKYIKDLTAWLSTMYVTVIVQDVGKQERAVSEFIGKNAEDYEFVQACVSRYEEEKQGVREIFVLDKNGTPKKHRAVAQDAIFSKPRGDSELKSQGDHCAILVTAPGTKNVTGKHWIASPKHIPLDQWKRIRSLLFNMMRIILGEDHFDTIALDVTEGDIDELFAAIQKSSTKDVKTRCRQIDKDIHNLVTTLDASNFNETCMAWLSRIRRKFLDYEKIITPETSDIETIKIHKAMMSDGTLLSLVTERLRLFMPNWIAKYDDVLIESHVTGSKVVAWDMSMIVLRAKSLNECDKLKIEPGVNIFTKKCYDTLMNSTKKPIQSVRQVSGLNDNQSMRYSIDNVTKDDIEAQIKNFNVKNGDAEKDTYDPAIAQQLKAEAERQGVLASVAQLQADVQAKQQATATAHQLEIAQLRDQVSDGS
jgi:hypothetical protein